MHEDVSHSDGNISIPYYEDISNYDGNISIPNGDISIHYIKIFLILTEIMSIPN